MDGIELEPNQNTLDVEGNEGTNIDELLERVAKAESLAKKFASENEKLKNSNDTMSKQIAERKREDRANKSEIEQKLEELEERNKALEESNRILTEESSRSKAVSAYKNLSEDIINELIEAAGVNADHSAIALIIEKEKKKVAAEKDAEWQKQRGNANTGTGNAPEEKSTPEKLVERRATVSQASNVDILSHYTR